LVDWDDVAGKLAVARHREASRSSRRRELARADHPVDRQTDHRSTVTKKEKDIDPDQSQKKKPDRVAPSAATAWSREACDVWLEAFGGVAPGGKIGRALKPLVTKFTWERVCRAWRVYCAQRDSRFCSASEFAERYFGPLDAQFEGGIDASLADHLRDPRRAY
jgi:hypothetical protein